MKKRIHAFASGKVQGVFFRANTKKEADRLKVTGWVRNLEDGRVEFVAEGEESNLVRLIEWAKKGPSWAKIDDFQTEWKEYEGIFNSFEIKN